jgi:hypothetical protein
MLKEDLQRAVEEVKERIEKHRTKYEGNEAMVSHQLVDPVLRALGWPTDDPDYVEYEERTEDGKPDWTLKWNEQKLFVETKSLDKDIRKSDTIRQLEGYLTGEGVEYGVITNGQRWLLFCVRPGTRREENILWQVDILEDPFDRVYRNLATIARENIDRIENLIEKNKKMEEVWEKLFNPKEPDPDLIRAVANLMRDKVREFQFQEGECEDFVISRIKGGFSGTIQEPPETNGNDLKTTTAGDWVYRKDLGKGIFVYKDNDTIRIDVDKPCREVISQLKKQGFKCRTSDAENGFYWRLRRRAGLIGKRPH